MKSSRQYVLLLLAVFLTAQFGFVLLLRPYHREWLSYDYWKNLFEIGEVMRLIHRDFVNEEPADYKSLRTSALRKMMGELDEYSEFMDAEYYEQFSMDSDQHYVGIGVEIQRVDFRVTLGQIFKGSPAGAAGMLPGDQIIEVDGENTEDFSVSQISDVLRGEEGAEVTIKVYRPLEDKEHIFTFERKPIDFPSIREIELSEDDWKIGYIRLTQFGRRSADEFSEALTDLEAQGMRALVFDLRNNPGGILPVAVEIAGELVNEGDLIVSTRGRDGVPQSEAFAEGSGGSREYPVVVLINDGSASASEIVSGALQDHGRAVVVGEVSVGKGTVQSIYELDEGMGLRMTTAMYYLPSGRTIHKVGVKPDFAVEMTASDRLKLFTQRNHLRYLNEEAFEKRFGFKPIQDPQLEAAYSVLKGVLSFQRG